VVRGMWKRQQIQPQGFIPVGEDHVLVPVRLVSVGRDGVETVAHGPTPNDGARGKDHSTETFQSKAEALEALGLSEEPCG
jgi:hypothetical protein